jgi:hypothetical protein
MRAFRPVVGLAKRLGVDRAIAYTLIGRAWSFIAGPITILLVGGFLTPEEQGYYYTFGSIVGLQIFFELGLSSVLVQFASHEMAELHWTKDGRLEGSKQHKFRLVTLLQKAARWYSALAAVVFLVLLTAGIVFFSRAHADSSVAWSGAWIWTVTAVAAALLTAPIISVLEGCGLVTEIARVRALHQLATSLLVWSMLVAGGRLFAAPIPPTVGLLLGIGWLLYTKRPFLRDVFSLRASEHPAINWKLEIWPVQWRIAVSGISGYFIFSLFAPVLFAFQGPVAAGQVGMSMMISNSISALALSWISTKAAPFGTLIARRRFVELDHLFFPALWKSLGIVVLCASGFWLVAWGLYQSEHPFRQRLLAPAPLVFLLVTGIANHIVAALAIYLRAHKREPYLILSVASAVLIGASSYILGRFYDATAMLAGAAIITLVVGLGGGTAIFLGMRRAWHAPEDLQGGRPT